MGVDGLCTDYPELVHESNRRLRPQASQTDAATFPFPQGPDAYSGVDLRGLAAPASSEGKVVASNATAGGDKDSDGNNSSSTASMSGSEGSNRSIRSSSSVSSHTGSTTTNKAEDSTDATVLGGWYSRCDTCEESAEGSDQQRLIAALYGDLAGVRDFAVRTVEDAKLLVKVCTGVCTVLCRCVRGCLCFLHGVRFVAAVTGCLSATAFYCIRLDKVTTVCQVLPGPTIIWMIRVGMRSCSF